MTLNQYHSFDRTFGDGTTPLAKVHDMHDRNPPAYFIRIDNLAADKARATNRGGAFGVGTYKIDIIAMCYLLRRIGIAVVRECEGVRSDIVDAAIYVRKEPSSGNFRSLSFFCWASIEGPTRHDVARVSPIVVQPPYTAMALAQSDRGHVIYVEAVKCSGLRANMVGEFFGVQSTFKVKAYFE